ncbi:hypothetical protein BD626DRAFT_444173, partial [Schizophyllum amplum]
MTTSTFDPQAVLQQLKLAQPTIQAGKVFESDWKTAVTKRKETWKKNQPRDSSTNIAQLEWAAEVVQYVTHLHELVAIHGNSKNKDTVKLLPKTVPLLGPHFTPPPYVYQRLREAYPAITPTTLYIKPIHVVHPLFYPSLGARCPVCTADDVHWHGWVNTGPRDVHGLQREETAIGYQLRCDSCKAAKSKQYCYAATSKEFWGNA